MAPPNPSHPYSDSRDRLFQECANKLEAGDPEANDLLHQVSQHTNYAPGWVIIGQALRRLGRHDAAVVALDTALAARPDHASALLWKAECLLDLNRLQEAEKVLTPWANHPTNAGAIAHSRGRIAYAAGRLNNARELLLRATRLQPAVASAWFRLGLVCQDLGDNRSGAEYYARALAIEPNMFEAAINRGTCLQAMHHIDAALRAYAQAYMVKPESLGRIAHALTSEASGRLWLNFDVLAAELKDIAEQG